MTEFLETIIINPKTQRDIELIINKYSNESFRTQSQTGGNVVVLRRLREEAIEIMGENIEGMVKEIEPKDNEITFVADKVGILFEEII